jgi:hypothetical protein
LGKLCLSLKGSIYDEPIAMKRRIQMSSIKKLAVYIKLKAESSKLKAR